MPVIPAWEGPPGNWLPKIHFIMLGYVDTPRPLQPWSRDPGYYWHRCRFWHWSMWCWLCLHSECKSCTDQETFTQISEEGLEGQARSLWESSAWSCGNEAKGTVGTPGSWRFQECGTSAEESYTQCRVGERLVGATIKAIAMGPLSPLESHLTTISLDAQYGATEPNIT